MARKGNHATYANGNVHYNNGLIPSGYKDLNGDGTPDSPNAIHYTYRDTISGAKFTAFGDPTHQYYLDVDGIYVPKDYGYLYYENIFGSGSVWYGKLAEGSYYRDNKGYFHEEGHGFVWDYNSAGTGFWNYGKIEDIEARNGVQYIDLDKDAVFTLKPDALMLPEFLALFSDDQKEGHGLGTHLVIQGKEVPALLAHEAYLSEYDKHDGLVKEDIARKFVGKVATAYQEAKTPTIVSLDPETQAQDSSNHYHTSQSDISPSVIEEKAVLTEVHPNSIAAIDQNKGKASSSLPTNSIINITDEPLAPEVSSDLPDIKVEDAPLGQDSVNGIFNIFKKNSSGGAGNSRFFDTETPVEDTEISVGNSRFFDNYAPTDEFLEEWYTFSKRTMLETKNFQKLESFKENKLQLWKSHKEIYEFEENEYNFEKEFDQWFNKEKGEAVSEENYHDYNRMREEMRTLRNQNIDEYRELVSERVSEETPISTDIDVEAEVESYFKVYTKFMSRFLEEEPEIADVDLNEVLGEHQGIIDEMIDADPKRFGEILKSFMDEVNENTRSLEQQKNFYQRLFPKGEVSEEEFLKGYNKVNENFGNFGKEVLEKLDEGLGEEGNSFLDEAMRELIKVNIRKSESSSILSEQQENFYQRLFSKEEISEEEFLKGYTETNRLFDNLGEQILKDIENGSFSEGGIDKASNILRKLVKLYADKEEAPVSRPDGGTPFYDSEVGEEALTESEQSITESEQSITESEQSITESEQSITESEQPINSLEVYNWDVDEEVLTESEQSSINSLEGFDDDLETGNDTVLVEYDTESPDVVSNELPTILEETPEGLESLEGDLASVEETEGVMATIASVIPV